MATLGANVPFFKDEHKRLLVRRYLTVAEILEATEKRHWFGWWSHLWVEGVCEYEWTR